jgi:hypothetical protein
MLLQCDGGTDFLAAGWGPVEPTPLNPEFGSERKASLFGAHVKVVVGVKLVVQFLLRFLNQSGVFGDEIVGEIVESSFGIADFVVHVVNESQRDQVSAFGEGRAGYLAFVGVSSTITSDQKKMLIVVGFKNLLAQPKTLFVGCRLDFGDVSLANQTGSMESEQQAGREFKNVGFFGFVFGNGLLKIGGHFVSRL